MRKIINDPLVDQDIGLLSRSPHSGATYLIKSQGVTRLPPKFTVFYIKTILQELESESYTNINLKREPPIEELAKNILKKIRIPHKNIENFKDPESGEEQIIVTIPLNSTIEDPFEELDKIHKRLSKANPKLATKVILLPAEPTE